MISSFPAKPQEGQGSSQDSVTRTLAELQAFQTRTSVLQEIGTAITKCLSLNEILQEVKQRTKWLLDFNHCSMYIKQPTDAFQFITILGPETSVQVFDTDNGTNLVQQTIQSKQPKLIKDKTNVPVGLPYQSLIIVPLESEGHILGTLNFASCNNYNFNDLRLCNLLCMQLAAAIRNAQHFEELNALYAELEQTYGSLRQVEELRDDLTRIIVHDLRNPLNIITGSLEILELVLNEPDQAAARAKWVQNAYNASQQMVTMIDDLLDVSKLDDQQLPLNLVQLELASLLAIKAKLFQSRAEKDEKTVTVQVEANLPPVIADTKLISRVLDNLIGNAFKYTSKGGHIQLTARLNQQLLEVTVSDDGQGIPAEYHQTIFNKFYQVVDEDGNPLRQGSGLGLAFCKLAVEAHGGHIWVDSKSGQGSNFSFTLPLTNG